MDIEELTHATASRYTEEEQIKSALAYFVNQVRNDGIVGKYLLAFIADGVENHLADKKPWPAKRGLKTQALAITFPYYYEYLKLEGSKDIYNKIINSVHPDDDSGVPDMRTVERYIKRAKESLEGSKARFKSIHSFWLWCMVNHKEVPERFQ